MIEEEIEETAHVFKAVTVLLEEDVCDEEEALIIEEFQTRILQDLSDGYDAYKDTYIEITEATDIDEAALLQDYVTENALSKGLARLAAFADLYHILRISEKRNAPQSGALAGTFQDRQHSLCAMLKKNILDDLDLYVSSYLVSETSMDADKQSFESDEEEWDNVQSIRQTILSAESDILKPSEISFLLPAKLEDALTSTRQEMEFHTAVKTELRMVDESIFLNRRDALEGFIGTINPLLQRYKAETSNVIDKLAPKSPRLI